MREAVIIIPSRLDSSRVHGKALRKVEGKPLIRNVYERCLETGFRTYVATDAREIASLFEDDVILTGPARNGSERVGLAARELGLTNGDWIINVQGDKLVNPESVKFLERSLNFNDSYHTLYCMNEDRAGGVRVLVNKDDEALYFTRKPIPNSAHHCGVYAYTGAFLQRYLKWDSTWEWDENLEQMRVLENGCRVKCYKFDGDSGRSINTVDDLGR